jgi:pimeloyl-ACP methyl ester carboxylesterase
MAQRLSPAILALVLVAAACGSTGPSPSPAAASPSATATPPIATSSPTSTPAHTAAPSATQTSSAARFDIGGYELFLDCTGMGAPTVVMDAGLNADHDAWAAVRSRVEGTTRVCTYDRANLGASDRRPVQQGAANRSTVGAMADELATLLRVAGIRGPLVLVGHSYGGMIVQVFAARHHDDVAGLVFVDSSTVGQYEGDWLADDDGWSDGATDIDRPASAVELHAADDFGATPTVVITQGAWIGEFEATWSRFQDRLAAESTDAVHVVARDSGHLINQDNPDIVAAAVQEVLAAVRSRATLPACGAPLTSVGGECLATTMSDLYDRWTALRSVVKARPGDLPSGVYTVTLTRADYRRIAGVDASQQQDDFTWTLKGGHWSLSVVTNGRAPSTASDIYAVDGSTVTVRLPLDWKIPRTPGLNTLTWAVDADGTLHLKQTDTYAIEPVYAMPWNRTGNAP